MDRLSILRLDDPNFFYSDDYNQEYKENGQENLYINSQSEISPIKTNGIFS